MGYLGYFPHPYQGEALYSVFARFFCHMNFIDVLHQRFIAEVQGCCISIECPSRINHLLNATALGNVYTCEDIIKEFTAFPFHMAFASIEKRKEQKNKLINGNRDRTKYFYNKHTRMKYVLKYCPECVRADVNSYGEPFWHIVHQLPGVFVCPIHEVSLLDYCSHCARTTKGGAVKYAALNQICQCGNRLDTCSKELHQLHKKMLGFARDANWLLANGLSLNVQKIISRYQIKLKEMGLISNRCSIVQKKTIQDLFVDYHGLEFLHLLGCDRGMKYWIGHCVTKGIADPIGNILMIQFLSGNIKEFLNEEKEKLYFGKGPWPCVNKLSDHYRKNTILSYSLVKRAPGMAGVFKCEDCGFSYEILEKDYKDGMQNPIYRIREVGHTFKERAEQLHSNKVSIEKIALETGVGSWMLKSCLEGKIRRKGDPGKRMRDSRRKNYRESILNAVSNGLEKGQIRKSYEKEMLWLGRNDAEWLETVLPRQLPHEIAPKRVDWQKRDEILAKKIRKAAQNYYESDTEKPTILTRIKLARILDEKQLLRIKNDRRLPLTNEALAEVLESMEHFYIRKIRWAIDSLNADGKLVSPKNICEVTSLNALPRGKINDLINEEIRSKIK